MINGENLFKVVGAIVAVIIQIFIAPHIAVFSAVPNFVVAFVIVMAVVKPERFGPVFPFVLGLLFDLFSGGPVGAMAFSLTLFSMIVARFLSQLNNDTVFMAIMSIALGILLVELSYGVFLLLFGYNAGIFEAIAFRVVPCFIYDLVIGAVLYPLATRFLDGGESQVIGITQLR